MGGSTVGPDWINDRYGFVSQLICYYSQIPALLERTFSHPHEFLKELHEFTVLAPGLLSFFRPLTMPVIPMCLSSGCAGTIPAMHSAATVRHSWSTAGLPGCSAMGTAAWVLL